MQVNQQRPIEGYERVEYRIKPVTRYAVHRYVEWKSGMKESGERGEFANADLAYEVGYSLAKLDAELQGWTNPGDDRIRFPMQDDARMVPTLALPYVEKLIEAAREVVECATDKDCVIEGRDVGRLDVALSHFKSFPLGGVTLVG